MLKTGSKSEAKLDNTLPYNHNLSIIQQQSYYILSWHIN